MTLACPPVPDVTGTRSARGPTRERDVVPALARPDRGRDGSIETLRGLAIVLMVLGHVIGNSPARGLEVPDDSPYRHFYFSTEYLRMPLFTVISGFVYALRPLQPGRTRAFLRGKGRRLLIPLAIVATLQFVAQQVVAGTHARHEWSDFWRIFVYGYDQFWFLQALFGVFLVVAAIEGRNLMATPGRWLACVAVALVASRYMPKIDLFSLWGFLFLLPYFLLGCGLCRFEGFAGRVTVTMAAASMLAIGMLRQEAGWRGGALPEFDPTGWLASSIGIGGCVLLFRFRRPVAGLARLGTHSFAIYLFHVFATGGARIALSRMGIHRHSLNIAIGLAAGLLLPIVAESAIRRSRWLRAALLGTR